MKIKKLSTCLSVVVMLICCSCGISKNNEPSIKHCPFTSLDWEATQTSVFELEGLEYTDYHSIYNGLTYTYPKEYNNRNGTIKYMFNSEDVLVRVAWTCNCADSKDLLNLFNEITKYVEHYYEKSHYSHSSETNYGNVWYLNSGNIILSTWSLKNQYVLQFEFANPVSD